MVAALPVRERKEVTDTLTGGNLTSAWKHRLGGKAFQLMPVVIRGIERYEYVECLADADRKGTLQVVLEILTERGCKVD